MGENGEVHPGAPASLSRRSTFALLVIGAFGPVLPARAADARPTAPPGPLAQAHARIAGEDAICMGTRLLRLLDPVALRSLVDAQGTRFAAAMNGRSDGRTREVFAALAAADFCAGRVRIVRDVWLADIEVALLVAPLVHEAAARTD